MYIHIHQRMFSGLRPSILGIKHEMYLCLFIKQGNYMLHDTDGKLFESIFHGTIVLLDLL